VVMVVVVVAVAAAACLGWSAVLNICELLVRGHYRLDGLPVTYPPVSGVYCHLDNYIYMFTLLLAGCRCKMLRLILRLYITGVELESIHKFLSTLGVQRLTECILVVPQTELYKPCPSLQSYVRQLVPWIQKQLYTEFTETYNFLVSSGIRARLAVMRFAQV